MTLDDELRAALHGRAAALAPSPDPLSGIEHRARTIRRTRVGAAVAGSALAVAAVAAVVPALQSAGTTTGPRPPVVASAAPSPSPAAASYALDPADPWPFRGTPVDEGTRATVEREVATRTGAEQVRLTPLFAQEDEPSGRLEVVYVADVDGRDRWGVAATGESGPEVLWDAPLAAGEVALVAALPGDEVARLLVVASPAATALEYGPDAASEYRPLAPLGRGVGTSPLDGDRATDVYRVRIDSGGASATVGGDAPDPLPTGSADEVDGAAYGLDADDPWPVRGDGSTALAADDERLFRATDPARGSGWRAQPLYAGSSDAGMSYLLVLHTQDGEVPVVTTTWQRGDRAAEQSEQGVEPDQRLVQVLVPTDLDDGSVLLVVLASPEAGAVVLEQDAGPRPDGADEPGTGRWLLERGGRDGLLRLYTGGDGVEYWSEPVDVGPDA